MTTMPSTQDRRRELAEKLVKRANELLGNPPYEAPDRQSDQDDNSVDTSSESYDDTSPGSTGQIRIWTGLAPTSDEEPKARWSRLAAEATDYLRPAYRSSAMPNLGRLWAARAIKSNLPDDLDAPSSWNRYNYSIPTHFVSTWDAPRVPVDPFIETVQYRTSDDVLKVADVLGRNHAVLIYLATTDAHHADGLTYLTALAQATEARLSTRGASCYLISPTRLVVNFDHEDDHWPGNTARYVSDA